MNKLTQNLNQTVPAEENFLEWKKIQNDFLMTFGKEVYESWIKNIYLIHEYIIMLFYLPLPDL